MAKVLTDAAVRRLIAAQDFGRKPHGGVPGLALEHDARGARWVLRVSVSGKRQTYGLGSFRDVPCTDAAKLAKVKRREALAGVATSVRAEREAARSKVPTVMDGARAVVEKRRGEWKPSAADAKAADWINSIARHAARIADMRVDEVTARDVADVLNPLAKSSPVMQRRIQQRLGVIFGWAVASEHRRSGDNPADKRIQEHLTTRAKVRTRHHAAANAKDVACILADVDAHSHRPVALAVRLLALTAVRKENVRLARWDEIDLDAKIWSLADGRMKTGKAHRVPLSEAAVAVLREAQSMTGKAGYVFANHWKPDAPISRNAIYQAVSKAGLRCRVGKVTAHGFRTSFKEWARTQPFADELSEIALAHDADAVRRAYARGDLLDRRRALMDAWAEYVAA